MKKLSILFVASFVFSALVCSFSPALVKKGPNILAVWGKDLKSIALVPATVM